MSFQMPPDPHPGLRYRRGRVLIPTLVIVAFLTVLYVIFTSFYTELLWYRSIDMSSVFTTALLTRAGLFLVFGALLGAAVGLNAFIAYRTRPPYSPMSPEQQNLDRYRMGIEPFRTLATVVASVLLGLLGALSAASQWKTYLLWRNGGSFGVKDPQFGKDIGFFAFDLPWYHFVVDFAFVALTLAILTAVLTHYLYGGIRLQGSGERSTPAARTHISVLLGVFVLLKAVAYLLDRYELAVAPGHIGKADFTGLSYTDINAVLPAKTILFWISLICASLFFVNIVRRTWLLPGLGFGLLVISAVLIGGIVPALYQQLRVRPSIAERESPQIAKNIGATRIAYGLHDVSEQPYSGAATTPSKGFVDTSTVRNIRLVDPTVINAVVTRDQRYNTFYDFNDPLDVDRYKVGDSTQDTVVAVRELDLNGLQSQQRNWINDRTTYTHGYGFVAARGNQTTTIGEPTYIDANDAPSLQLTKPQIYFGEKSPSYSVVGAPKGTAPVEYESHGDESDASGNTTYDGSGGVAIGSLFRRLLYATKYHDTNLLLSNRVNSVSRLLDDRQPRQRVQKAAPWLKVDGNPYPAVIGGRVLWILDGYTTSDGFPYSTRTTLGDVTADALTGVGAVAAQRNDEVNYIRNSVRATVDAYDGTVTLYEWDPNDPVLKAWRKAFPNTVKKRAEISPELLAHLRYPEDLFKVQRELYSRYHETRPKQFFDGSTFWRVPKEPAAASNGTDVNADQPPYYYTLQVPGSTAPTFSLNTAFTFVGNNPNLAAFMTADSDATSTHYGALDVLAVPTSTVKGPTLVQNLFTADGTFAQFINQIKLGNKVDYGNLLTLPVGGGFLYVEPVYVRQPGGIPLLQKVLVSFGNAVAFEDTLPKALAKLVGGAAPTTPPPSPDSPTTPPAGGGGQLDQALADAQQALNDAQKALAATPQDWTLYGDAQKRLTAAISRALALQKGQTVSPAPPTPGSTSSPTASPSAPTTVVPTPAPSAGG